MSDLYFDIIDRSSSSSSTSTSSSSESSSSISSSSSSSSLSVSAGWNETYLSDTYWQGEPLGSGTWIPSANAWDSEDVANSAVILVSASTWQENYRPTKVRVTTSPIVTGAIFSLDSKFGNIVTDLAYLSSREVDITVTNDIYGLTIIDDNPFRITAIGFYEG